MSENTKPRSRRAVASTELVADSRRDVALNGRLYLGDRYGEEPAMRVAKPTSGDHCGFRAVFGERRGHQPGRMPPAPTRPAAITRARALVAWANAAEMITTHPDFWDLLVPKAVEIGLSIEFLAFGPQQSEDERPHYVNHDIPVLASLYDTDMQTVVGAIELTGSKAFLLHYDQPFPRRIRL